MTMEGTRALAATPADEEAAVLLRACYQLIAANPDRPFTLKELLDETGLSTRAFYRHFDTKDDLLVAIYQQDATRFASELRQRIAEAPTPSAAVAAWIDQWVSTVFDARRSRRIHVLRSAQFLTVDGMRRAVTESWARSVEILARVITAGHDAGTFPAASPDIDARSMQMVVLDLLNAQEEDRLTGSPDEVTQSLLRIAGHLLGCSLAASAERRS
jgi:AcrR family transcriptional regulator